MKNAAFPIFRVHYDQYPRAWSIIYPIVRQSPLTAFVVESLTAVHEAIAANVESIMRYDEIDSFTFEEDFFNRDELHEFLRNQFERRFAITVKKGDRYDLYCWTAMDIVAAVFKSMKVAVGGKWSLSSCGHTIARWNDNGIGWQCGKEFELRCWIGSGFKLNQTVFESIEKIVESDEAHGDKGAKNQVHPRGEEEKCDVVESAADSTVSIKVCEMIYI